MRRVCLILNPNSGANRNRPRLRESLEQWAVDAGLDAEICPTVRVGHAREIAHEASKQFDCVVAVGGDGTVNEVACGAMESGVPVGIIPCGSGNGLARHLRIPMNPRAAMRVLASGQIRTIDTGTANGHRFVTAMGVGFDAEITRRFNEMPTRGLSSYVSIGTRLFFSYKPGHYTVSSGDRSVKLTPFLVSVANSDQLGNNARIAPRARVDDGVLDLVALEPPGIFSSLGMAVRLFTGSLDRARGVTRMAGTRFEIRREGDGVIHVDGETRTAGPVIEVEVHPGSLRVIVPG
ncbi:MAG TPA: diacylglycerol kinase family protein [Opitutaceae bacterium]|nr:diacylglycerol kinase family protein [Opitutaceae bacterium]